MNLWKRVASTVVLCVVLQWCNPELADASTPNTVTADIQAGREKYIEDETSLGGDLEFGPGHKSGTINFLAYPVLEIGGEPAKVKVEFSFNRNITDT